MKHYSQPNSYQMTIQGGLDYIRSISGRGVVGQSLSPSTLEQLRQMIQEADAIVIGAGAGLSTASGFTYSGDRFERYFFDFAKRFGIEDMYSGGFYPFPDSETKWAWWARAIYVNRYVSPAKPVYEQLLSLMEDKDYFVITTNVDHQFQRAGFDKKRLFYTQGDYGLFQDSSHTYDNVDWVMSAMEAQGFVKDEDGIYVAPEGQPLHMSLPTDMIPRDSNGTELIMNLRIDNSFVEDEGWHAAANRYGTFLEQHAHHRALYLELGVGSNTPVIMKYPFWYQTATNPHAQYVSLNLHEAIMPIEIAEQGLVVNDDIAVIIEQLLL